MLSKNRTNRTLEIVLISTAIMVCAMSVLLFAVYRSRVNKAGDSDASLDATLSFQGTLDAIVSATLEANQVQNQPVDPAEDQWKDEEILPSFTPESQEVMDSGVVPTETSLPPPTQTEIEPATPTPQPTRTPAVWVEEMLASMSLSQKVGQMILTGVNGTELTTATCQFVRRVSPGGIIYIGSNVSSPSPTHLNALSDGLQNCISESVGIPLFISIDHEGPYVNRFPYGSQMTVFPAAMAFGATQKPNLAYQAALASGLELRANGVNMVLGPVADVLTNLNNTVISIRSYGGNPADVSLFVSNAVLGYLDAGVLPVLKHYPGHGGVSGDSHTVLPLDNASETDLLSTHLVPFQGGIDSGAPSVMVSHVAFPAVDSGNLPASLSSELYDLLDEAMGFRGFTMSDSMGMGAVSSTGLGVEAASIEAVNAGLDMLMLVSPDSAESVYNSVLNAAMTGEIPVERIDQAVRNILNVKYQHGLASFPLQGAQSPDWSADVDLAYDIGYRAVSLYKDDLNLVPLSGDIRKVLIVGPTDGWGLYNRLGSALSQRGITYSTLNYSGYWYGPIPETSLLQTVPARAAENDLVIVFTWDSHPNQYVFGDTFQVQLVNALLDQGYNPVVVALKSPVDIIDFPRVKTYLATMGTTPGQLDAMVQVLMGNDDPKGSIPLSGLP